MFARFIPPVAAPLVHQWSFGKFSPEACQDRISLGTFTTPLIETQVNTSALAAQRTFFATDLERVAYNTASIDTMCAFYFAAQHDKVFQGMAHQYQRQLERQSDRTSTTRSGQGRTTGPFQHHNNPLLGEATQAAAQRLKVALSRVEKGDQYLPPWGPPLLPQDAPIQEVDEWIFPIPWMVIHDSASDDLIRIATATAEDPTICSRIMPIGAAARAGVPPRNAPFWSIDRKMAAPAVAACFKIANRGAALAKAASSNTAQGGPSSAVRTSEGAARTGAAATSSATGSTVRIGRTATPANVESTARGSNQYVPPPLITSRRTAEAGPFTATATAATLVRPNIPPSRREAATAARRNVLTKATKAEKLKPNESANVTSKPGLSSPRSRARPSSSAASIQPGAQPSLRQPRDPQGNRKQGNVVDKYA
jgi:hypothetical protein